MCAGFQHQPDIVLDQQDATADLGHDPPNQLGQLIRLMRRHAGRRFIQQQELRLQHQRAGNADASLVGVGKRPGRKLHQWRDPDPVEHFHRPRRRGPAAEAKTHARHFQIVENAELLEQPPALERPRHTKAPQLVRGHARHILPVMTDRSLCRRLKPGQHIDQRRLARAIGPDQPRHFRRRNIKVDVRQRMQPVKRDRDILCLQKM